MKKKRGGKRQFRMGNRGRVPICILGLGGKRKRNSPLCVLPKSSTKEGDLDGEKKRTNICIFLDPSSGIRETNGPSPGGPGAHFPFQLPQKPINFTSFTFSPPLRLKAWTSQKQGTKTSYFYFSALATYPRTQWRGPKERKPPNSHK